MITSKQLSFCSGRITIVATEKTRLLFAGSRSEPPDVCTVYREMFCNGAPVRPVGRYEKMFRKVMDEGRWA